MPAPIATPDAFTTAETRALAPYFTNTDRPVFALTNLPETVKGALFARYSRSAKSVRRLFLDEFIGEMDTGWSASSVNGGEKAPRPSAAGPSRNAGGAVGIAPDGELFACGLLGYSTGTDQ